MREVLRRACSEEFGHEVVGEARSGHQVVETVARTTPDLLLLDLQLPELSGLDALEQLRQRHCRFKTLVLSSCCDDYTVFRVERERVNGFVLKNTSTISILGRALDAISRGQVYFSEAFIAKSAERRADPTAFDKLLTDRERIILIMISRSPGDRTVADQLGISVATVEKHRFNIFRKLGLRSTAELVRFAHMHGFNQLEIVRAEN